MSRWLQAALVDPEDFNLVAEGLKKGESTGSIVEQLKAKGYTVEKAFEVFYDAKKQYEQNYAQVTTDVQLGKPEGETLDKIDAPTVEEKFDIYYNNKNNFEDTNKLK